MFKREKTIVAAGNGRWNDMNIDKLQTFRGDFYGIQ